MAYLADIEIAQATKTAPIMEIVRFMGFTSEV